MVHTNRFQGTYFDIFLIMNIIVGCSIIAVIMIMVIIIIIVVVVVVDDDVVVVVIKISTPGTDRKLCTYRISFCSLRSLVESVCIKLEMVIFSFIHDRIIIGVAVVCSGGIATGIAIVCLERSIVFIV